MSAAQLKPHLASGSLMSDRLRDAADICSSWYSAEPSLVTFTLLSLFKDLIERGWADSQGVPSAQYQPFERVSANTSRTVLCQYIPNRRGLQCA
jgi:hypothetical protein